MSSNKEINKEHKLRYVPSSETCTHSRQWLCSKLSHASGVTVCPLDRSKPKAEVLCSKRRKKVAVISFIFPLRPGFGICPSLVQVARILTCMTVCRRTTESRTPADGGCLSNHMRHQHAERHSLLTCFARPLAFSCVGWIILFWTSRQVTCSG
jgi:hypothetical protein